MQIIEFQADKTKGVSQEYWQIYSGFGFKYGSITGVKFQGGNGFTLTEVE